MACGAAFVRFRADRSHRDGPHGTCHTISCSSPGRGGLTCAGRRGRPRSRRTDTCGEGSRELCRPIPLARSLRVTWPQTPEHSPVSRQDGGLWSLRPRCLSRGVGSARFSVSRMRCASGRCGRCRPAAGKPVSGRAARRAVAGSVSGSGAGSCRWERLRRRPGRGRVREPQPACEEP